jgi:hypothetical protein
MRVLLSSIILSLFLISCSTGKKAYERGDYYQATLQAVNRLRGNPDSEKALDALSHSYPSAIKYFQEQIDFALSANRPFKYSEIVDYYQMLNNLGDEISRCPAAMRMFPDVSLYAAELAQAKQMAAEEQYIAGLANEKQDTRLSWKSAYFNFQQADCFVPGYKDVRERMGTAKFYATWKVIVEQIQVPRNYQLSSDFFLNQVVEYLTSHRPNEFVEYYSPQSAEKAGLKMPDQVLRMNFDEFVVGQVYDKETIRDLSKDSVVVGNVTMPDGSVKNVYNTVKAKLITYRREVSSNGVLDVTIIDWPLNNVVSQRKFPGQFVWFTEWSTFQGDERALSKDQLALCDRKPVPPPPPQNLFIEFTKPIFNQVTPFLQDFYRKY